MIRVIIERRLKKGEQISSLLRQLRTGAMGARGYIGGETLVDTEDANIIMVISTWKSVEDWRAWETSERRVFLDRQVKSLLVEPPVIRTYRILSTEELEYLEDPASWLQERERPSFNG